MVGSAAGCQEVFSRGVKIVHGPVDDRAAAAWVALVLGGVEAVLDTVEVDLGVEDVSPPARRLLQVESEDHDGTDTAEHEDSPLPGKTPTVYGGQLATLPPPVFMGRGAHAAEDRAIR